MKMFNAYLFVLHIHKGIYVSYRVQIGRCNDDEFVPRININTTKSWIFIILRFVTNVKPCKGMCGNNYLCWAMLRGTNNIEVCYISINNC